MDSNYIPVSLVILWGIAYVVIAVVLYLRRGIREPLAQTLMIYSVAAALFALLQAISLVSGLEQVMYELLRLIANYGSLGLLLILVFCSFELLAVKAKRKIWFVLGGVIFFGFTLLIVTIIVLPIIRQVYEGWIDQAYFALNFLIIFSWVVIIGYLAYTTVSSYRVVKRPLHKNRLFYWTTSLCFFAIADLFVFFHIYPFSGAFRLLGLLLLSYVALIHNLVDLFQTGLQTLRYLVITLVSVVVYAAVILIVHSLVRDNPVFTVMIEGIMLAGILVILINPVLNTIANHVNRSVFGLGYDPNDIIREYSIGISNIVELDRLEQVSLGLIQKTIGTKTGWIYLVDELDKNESNHYHLEPIKGNEMRETRRKGSLNVKSPVALQLSQERRPLTQYDIDYLPRYRQIRPEERQWLTEQDIDVFVPIHSKDKWIGLFALGAKDNGERYYDEDLLLLSTLADQSAVALENARIFTDLHRINQDLERAHTELEAANKQLREVDELKSSFVSVVSHELRTPLANLAFSLQILEMYGREQLLPEQRDLLDQVTNNMSLARKMVDNLVLFAMLVNDQYPIQIDEIDIQSLVNDTVSSLRLFIEEKGMIVQTEFIGELFKVNGDRKLLREAIYHLVHNAVKYTNSGGKIWISSWSTTDMIYLDVKDTGVGVPAEKLATLWNSFSQGADPVRRGLEGLGLGLVLVKMIVGLHNGRVWVESKEQHGSSFGFQLPITKGTPPRRSLDTIVMKEIPRSDSFLKTKPITQ